MARSKYNELLKKVPKWLADEAGLFDEGINEGYQNSVLKEIDIALSNKAVYAKEYVEFGVFEALFALSKELKTGLLIDIKAIPIKQETVEVCEALGCNPYALYSGYSAVIATPCGEELKNILAEAGILANIVGHTTDNNDKILINEDERSFLPHIRKDELKNILGRREYYERTDSVNC